MPPIEPSPHPPGGLPAEDDLAVFAKVKRRNRLYMIAALAAFALLFVIATGLVLRLVGRLEQRLAEARGETQRLQEAVSRELKNLETEIATQSEKIRAQSSTLEKTSRLLESLERRGNAAQTRMRQQEEDLKKEMARASAAIQKEREEISQELARTSESIEAEMKRLEGSMGDQRVLISEQAKLIGDLAAARAELRAAVFDAGSFVLIEYDENRILLGPRDEVSDFVISLGTVHRDRLEKVRISDPSKRALYPAEGGEGSDVRLGQEIQFAQDGYCLTLTVRYVHEQFFTNDVAGVDIKRRKGGHCGTLTGAP